MIPNMNEEAETEQEVERKNTERRTREHYDLLIEEGNDPIFDSDELLEYMNKWDGEIFLNELSVNAESDVLEIGVGTGRLARKVAPRCRHFTGIDFSEKTAKRAAEHLSDIGNVSIICDDFLTYPFFQKFDFIYSSLTWMHIKDKSFAAAKVSRLLKSGGRFILSVDKSSRKIISMGNREIPVYPDNPRELCKDMKQAGMNIQAVLETEFAYVIVASIP